MNKGLIKPPVVKGLISLPHTEYCDMGYLRDYVLNTANDIDSPDLAMQIANGSCVCNFDVLYACVCVFYVLICMYLVCAKYLCGSF